MASLCFLGKHDVAMRSLAAAGDVAAQLQILQVIVNHGAGDADGFGGFLHRRGFPVRLLIGAEEIEDFLFAFAEVLVDGEHERSLYLSMTCCNRIDCTARLSMSLVY